MSEYVVCNTQIKDLDVLKQSLIELGVKEEHIEVHETPINLHGYKGDKRTQKAHVVIQRKHVGGSSNDIGFERTSEGTYKSWVSEFDKDRGLGHKIASKELERTYARNSSIKQATKMGYKIVSNTTKDGKIRIRLRRS